MCDDIPTHTWHGHQDYVSGDIGGVGSAHGTDDERDDIILYDARGKAAVTTRYRRRVGYEHWR